MNWLTWDDLTEEEKEQAINSYACIRECEEGEPCSRERATENIDCCRFERQEDGYIFVNI